MKADHRLAGQHNLAVDLQRDRMRDFRRAAEVDQTDPAGAERRIEAAIRVVTRQRECELVPSAPLPATTILPSLEE